MPTKKYFGTDGIRSRVGDEPITPEFVLKLGWAVGRVFSNGRRKKVIIGKDTRLSGYLLESALEAGLSAAGADIVLTGPMPTPAIAYLTQTFRADAGIVISASHNPYEDNGIKFFSNHGVKLSDEIELEIERQLDEPIVTVAPESLGRATRADDAPGRYIEFCKSTIGTDTKLNGLKIVVDCANGATYHTAPNVFRELGAEVIAIGVEPNGLNINDGCGSTHPQALQKAVLKHKADIGVALDGDGDRVVLVDSNGQLIDGDAILYVLLKDGIDKKLDTPKKLVGTLMSNMGLELACQRLGVEFHRSNVGDRYVLELMRETQAVLGGENSGHIVNSKYLSTGDGTITALQVLAAMASANKSLHELLEDYQAMPQVIENVRVNGDKKAIIEKSDVQGVLTDVENELGNKGRVLLRPSGTESLIRVMIEGEDKASIKNLAVRIAEVVALCDE